MGRSYTFPYKEGRVLGDLEGGLFGGREGGVAIYENPRFPASEPGVSQAQEIFNQHAPGSGVQFVLQPPCRIEIDLHA